MSYYDNSRPWLPIGSNAWNDIDVDNQTVRSASSSTVPTQGPPPPPQAHDATAFSHQMEEVDRAIDNLVKSGKMFGMPGRHGRQHGAGARPHSMAEFGDARGAHQSNLQNFYANQRHQSSRGSNEAEQMIQAKRRMAAQRERELRNYHQEQQYNRTVLAELSSYGGKQDRTLSPGSMSEAERRDLIARQRSALYGEGAFAETGGYVDETGTPRPGVPVVQHGPATTSLRGPSPLAYEYGRAPPVGPVTGAGAGIESGSPQELKAGSPLATGGRNEPARTNSTSSPRSNPVGDEQQAVRTTSSSPGTPPVNSKLGSGAPVNNGAVAPIGTRPSTNSATPSVTPSANAPPISTLSKRSGTPLASPMAHGFSASGALSENAPASIGGTSSNPPSATADGPIGVSGWGSRGSSVWGNNGKPGMGVQASVWG